jgi:hypothetical protein
MGLYLEEVFHCPGCSYSEPHRISLPSTREVIETSYSYVRALILVPLRLSSLGEVKVHEHST